MRVKVRKYTVEVGELEVDNVEDAALLLKYGHYPTMWQQLDKPRYKLVTGDEEKVIFINGRVNDQVEGSREENVLPSESKQ